MPTKFATARAALNDYRLAHDLTWAELSDQMAAAGLTISRPTLHMVCTSTGTPNDRTQYKVTTFVAHLADRATPPRAPRPKGKGRASRQAVRA